MAKSIEFMHYVRKSAYSHVKSGTLVTRLRAIRDTARTELRTTHQQLKEKEKKNLAVLEKFSGEVQQNLEKLKKEAAEAQLKIAGLSESLKKAEAATVEAKKMAEDAKHLAEDEAFARERAERIYSDFRVSFERNEGVLKRSLDFLRKGYEETSRELLFKKKDLEQVASEKRDYQHKATDAEQVLRNEISNKDQTILELRRSLLQAQQPPTSGLPLLEEIKKAIEELQAKFNTEIPLIKIQGAREWASSLDFEQAVKYDVGYIYAIGCSEMRLILKEKHSLDLNDYCNNGLERMTKDEITLFRKKKFPYPVNLPDTPEEHRQELIIEYEYKDSHPAADELPGLLEDYYTHLGVKHKKIKAHHRFKTPLNPEDPDLVYFLTGGYETEGESEERVPLAPVPIQEESSDAGLVNEETVTEGEVTSNAAEEGREKETTVEAADIKNSNP